METVANLVAEIQRAVHVDDTRGLTLLNRAYRAMVVRARSYRRTINVGPTAANVRDYALPPATPIVELFEVQVGGRVYGNAWHRDIAQYAGGYLVLSDDGGVIAPEEDVTGAPEIALIPTPSTAGLAIDVRAAWTPPELVLGDPASAIRVDHDLQGKMLRGAIADELEIIGEGDPALAAVTFEAACKEFDARTRRKYRGPGPAQIRVVGYNA